MKLFKGIRSSHPHTFQPSAVSPDNLNTCHQARSGATRYQGAAESVHRIAGGTNNNDVWNKDRAEPRTRSRTRPVQHAASVSGLSDLTSLDTLGCLLPAYILYVQYEALQPAALQGWNNSINREGTHAPHISRVSTREASTEKPSDDR